jgi:hypothetical protein
MKIDKEELKLFDLFLDSLYIKKKIDRNKIINIYRKLFKQRKTIIEFEKELEELGWDEITVNNISRYITNWNFRKDENEKIWKNKNK